MDWLRTHLDLLRVAEVLLSELRVGEYHGCLRQIFLNAEARPHELCL
jgi:hypothetical protein